MIISVVAAHFDCWLEGKNSLIREKSKKVNSLEEIENLLMFMYSLIFYCYFRSIFRVILERLVSAIAVTHAEEAVKMGSMVDDINAYSYAYPLDLPPEKLVFKWYAYVSESFDQVLPIDSYCISLFTFSMMQG